MRKMWLGLLALVSCTAVGIWLYARHASTGTVHRVVPVDVRVATPPPPAMDDWPAVPPLPAPEAEAVEPIIVENRPEPERIVPPFQTGQIFIVGDGETSEPIILPEREAAPLYMPYADAELAAPAKCGPAACPCCDWLIELVRKVTSILWSPAPVPVDLPVPSGGVENQEPPLDLRERLGLPSMREDPHYHHHYPSCPYTSGCPYPYHQYRMPVRPIERPVVPPAPLPETGPKAPTSSSRPAPDTDAGPTVDTMECRPSDLPPPSRRGRSL